MFVVALWNEGLHVLPWVAVATGSLLAAITDLRSREIGNVLTLPLLAGGIAWAWSTAGLAGAADALVACVVLAAPYVWLYARCGGGAGDAKLMGAIGAWLGLVHGLAVLLGVAISGTILGLLYLLAGSHRRGRPRTATAVPADLPHSPPAPGRAGSGSTVPPGTVPYGIAIFSGVAIWTIGVLLWLR